MRTRHQLATGLVVALTGASLAAPALAGSGQDLRSPDSIDAWSGAAPATVVTAQDLRSPDAADSRRAVVPPAAGAPVVITTGASQPSSASGFDWGSAAIGAAGTIGLVSVAFGSGLAVHRRRTPVPAPPIVN
jgi:hypothetical protein